MLDFVALPLLVSLGFWLFAGLLLGLDVAAFCSFAVLAELNFRSASSSVDTRVTYSQAMAPLQMKLAGMTPCAPSNGQDYSESMR